MSEPQNDMERVFGVPTPRPTRYDQCDETCTTDCGHCKGKGKPTDASRALQTVNEVLTDVSDYARRLEQQKDWKRQDADGTPFISYFAKETSFIWDGLSTTVQVCDGAAGEPVTDTFEIAASLPNYVSNLTPGVLLARFANACEFYLATRRQ